MMSFFEKFKQNVDCKPEQVVLLSNAHPKGITYKLLDELSGRICKYLKSKNIGKEDFVMILMPREASAFISVMGVWKSGAAMTLLEEDYPSDRVDYIKADLNCKLVITRDVFDRMMKCNSINDYELPSLHDACYVTYTSGSTGNPKGILHEFGKLDTFDYDYNNALRPLKNEGKFALLTPLNFSPSIRNAVSSLLNGKCLYIVPKNIVKEPQKLQQYFIDNRINETSVTCSFFKTYPSLFATMENVFVSAEPCNGIYEDGMNIINLYSLSEVAFPIYTFPIDKSYDKAPLGYANKNIDIKIINENGKNTQPYEVGEIIVEDIFTRGYINLPSKEKDSFINGYFHTSDLGYYDENGLVFLCGRKDDMVKINGNRIEPIEIENAVKKVLHIKNATAKGFIENKRSFIAVYFLRNELVQNNMLTEDSKFKYSISSMNDKLQDILPDYMMPSYYIVLDSYPKNDNGKFSRKDLPKPNADDYLKKYSQAQNDTETYFCHLFEKILNLNQVGIDDDFYQIGGDSMSSIQLITECTRFALTVSDIYRERTPRNLSACAQHLSPLKNFEEQNKHALSMPQPLLSEQRETFKWQMEFPDLNLHNLTRLFKLKETVDIEKFKTAVDKVLRHHPVFSSVLGNFSGVEKLVYKPELFQETRVKTISTAELQQLMANPCKPFSMENHLLYRHGIYQCNNASYFFLEIHHLITDGISIKLLLNEINNCYRNPEFLIPEDYFFLLLQKNAEKQGSTETTPNKIREFYKVTDFMTREDNSVRLDNLSYEVTPSKYEKILGIDKKRILKNSLFQKYRGNVFFLTCFLKAMSEFNQRNKVLSFWVYNGRDIEINQNAHGMIEKTMPIGLDFRSLRKDENTFEYVKSEISNQMTSNWDFIDGFTDDFLFTPFFIYQNDVLKSSEFTEIFEEEITIPNGCGVFEFHLIDNADEENFRYSVRYANGLYRQDSIQKFCQLYETIVNNIIATESCSQERNA